MSDIETVTDTPTETAEQQRRKNAPRTPEEASRISKEAWARRKAAAAEDEARRRAEANLPPTPKFVEVLERRLDDPHIYGDGKIELNIPGAWTCRWVNTDIEGRYDLTTRYRGWEPVKVAELKDQRQIPAFTSTPDGFVARGQRGAEILMRMPTEYWEQIQRRKTDMRKARSSGSKLRQDIQEHVAAIHNRPDVAERGSRLQPQLKESIEAVELDSSDMPPLDA